MGRVVRRALLILLVGLLACAPAASAGGPHMLVGAVEPDVLQPSEAEARQQLDLAQTARLAGAVRVALTWARGIAAPQDSTVSALQNAVAAAAANSTTLYTILYPSGSSQTPLSDADQGQFVSWVTAIARAVPGAHHYIIGNEPNLNRFWLPQFGPNGEDVAAPAYEALLARTYDALKEVDPKIEVIGGALSHAGVDRPGTGRDTHSPTQFLLDLGSAYRASGRTAPIMDALAFHPYMLDSNEPPTLQHPTSTTITINDYDKLVQTLGQAFDGTAQKGSDLALVYDEFGVQSITPPEKAELYTGKEAATVHPVDEATQAAFYAQAFQLAFCQQNVKAILVFPLIDEINLAGWQSGVYYTDKSPKTSLAAVRAAASRVRRNVIAPCDWLHVTPRPRVVFFPNGRPGAEPSRLPVPLTCDVDCVYRLRVERLPAHSTTLVQTGRLVGGVGKRILFPRTRLAPGTYRFTLSALATMNQGAPFTTASLPFTISRA
jgi:hypothetical protein